MNGRGRPGIVADAQNVRLDMTAPRSHEPVVNDLADAAGLRLRWAWYRAARRLGFGRRQALVATQTGVVDYDGIGAPTQGRAVVMRWLVLEGFPDHALLVVLRSGTAPADRSGIAPAKRPGG